MDYLYTREAANGIANRELYSITLGMRQLAIFCWLLAKKCPYTMDGFSAPYRYITLAFCGLSRHLLVQTMPWCPGYRDSIVHFIICIILSLFVFCHQIN